MRRAWTAAGLLGCVALVACGGGGSDSPTAPSTGELIIEDLVVGTGDPVAAGNVATVHYVGWLMDGTQFDSSRDRGEPFTFQVGAGRVIAGWDQGIPGMRVGGTRRLTIPPHLAYGSQGNGPIPPNATLRFEVELLSFQ